MKQNKKYFAEYSDDFAFPLEYWKKYMNENCLNELILYKAKAEMGQGFFFCKKNDESGIAKESCLDCSDYIPNNGKNGRCKYYGYCYEKTEKKIVLNKKYIIKLL